MELLAVVIGAAALAAWDYGRRRVAADMAVLEDKKQVAALRTSLDAEQDARIAVVEGLRAQLADHKSLHEAAIKNLAAETRSELAELRTKAGIAAQGVQRSAGRLKLR